MGRVFRAFFWEFLGNFNTDDVESQIVIYSCKKCSFQLTTNRHILSKSFHGHHGTAYLVERMINISERKATDRYLMTGKHQVRDVECRGCGTIVGWKYEISYEADQRYKEGKYVVERALLFYERIAASANANGNDNYVEEGTTSTESEENEESSSESDDEEFL